VSTVQLPTWQSADNRIDCLKFDLDQLFERSRRPSFGELSVRSYGLQYYLYENFFNIDPPTVMELIADIVQAAQGWAADHWGDEFEALCDLVLTLRCRMPSEFSDLDASRSGVQRLRRLRLDADQDGHGANAYALAA
jgi:hypothetical protein